jgi:ketosteroid isomerase-like protein
VPVPDRSGLELANKAFYDSFETLDLDAMMALWADTDDVHCVHPGSELIVGWAPVRRSWAAIFASTSYLQFIVTDVRAGAGQQLGWVTCTENILTSHAPADHLGGARALATNLFTWDGRRWLMMGHHASPILRPGIEEDD